jgi:Arc/MetJ family transcription regulator
MRMSIDIDNSLPAAAQKILGCATKQEAVAEALQLLVKLIRQRQVDTAFGKYQWRGNLGRSRKGRGFA